MESDSDHEEEESDKATVTKKGLRTGLLQFQNTLTTNFQKTSLTWEIDYYSCKILPDKNNDFKNLEKSGRVATLFKPMTMKIPCL